MPNFGECLKELRLEFGFGLRSFSEAMGIDPGNLSRIERGKLRPPREQAFYEAITNILDLSPDDEKIQRLKDLADAERLEQVSPEIGGYAREVELIPLLLRTVANKKLSKGEIRRLIEDIKTNY